MAFTGTPWPAYCSMTLREWSIAMMKTRFLKNIWTRHSTIQSGVLTASVAAFVGIQAPLAHADLAELIKAQPTDKIAVVTSASDNADDGYGILSMSYDDFAQQVQLIDPSKRVLENPYFRIVEGESNETLRVGDFDGDNVLYHLMHARAYYAKLAQASGYPDAALDPATAQQIIIRVRMQNDYNLMLHFSATPDYDNSRYIPAEPPMVKFINEQNKEKFVALFTQLTSDLGCTYTVGQNLDCPNDCGDLSADLAKSAVANQTYSPLGPEKNFVKDVATVIASKRSCSEKEAAITSSYLKALATVDIAPWNQEILFDKQKAVMAPVDWYNMATSAGLAASTSNWISLSATPLQLISNYNGGIDGEKIPDVVYHEAFHYSSDAEGLFPMASEGNPVAEDYANYFGSSLNGRPAMAEISELSSREYKHDYRKIPEIKDTFPSTYNATSFGTAIFWAIRDKLGQDRADQLVWNSLHFLDGSALHLDVPKAVSSAAHADNALSQEEVTWIDDLLSKYHQSYVNLEVKFNPGEASKLLDPDKVKKAGSDQADHLKNISGELQANGTPLDSETTSHISDVAEKLKGEANRPGFRSKVVIVLNSIAKAMKTTEVDTGKAFGYAGTVVSAAGNAPIDFGTDLVSAIIMGHGMLTGKELTTSKDPATGNELPAKYAGRDHGLDAQLTGAVGGVAATYYTYAGLAALGFSFTNVVSTSAFGVVFVNTEVCARSNPRRNNALDRYCAENTKLANSINSDTAKAGATLGTKVHEELVKIKLFFKKLFADAPQPTQAPQTPPASQDPQSDPQVPQDSQQPSENQ